MKSLYLLVFVLLISCTSSKFVLLENSLYFKDKNVNINDFYNKNILFEQNKIYNFVLKSTDKSSKYIKNITLKFLNSNINQKLNFNDTLYIILPKPDKGNDLIAYLEYEYATNNKSRPNIILSKPFIFPMRSIAKEIGFKTYKIFYLNPEFEKRRINVLINFGDLEKYIETIRLCVYYKYKIDTFNVQIDRSNHDKYINFEDNPLFFDELVNQINNKGYNEPFLHILNIKYNDENFKGCFYSAPNCNFDSPQDIVVPIKNSNKKLKMVEMTSSSYIHDFARCCVNQNLNITGKKIKVFKFVVVDLADNKREICEYKLRDIEPPSDCEEIANMISQMRSILRKGRIEGYDYEDLAFIVEGDAGPPEVGQIDNPYIPPKFTLYEDFYLKQNDSTIIQRPVMYAGTEKYYDAKERDNCLATLRACKIAQFLTKSLKRDAKTYEKTEDKIFATIADRFNKRAVNCYIVQILERTYHETKNN